MMADFASAQLPDSGSGAQDRGIPDGFARSVWNSFQSYLMICLILTSLFFIAAAALAGQISVIFGIIGLWIVLLDWTPMPGLLRRIGRTLIVSAKGTQETEADRVPVL